MIQWIIFTDERAGRPRASDSQSESYHADLPPGRGRKRPPPVADEGR